MSLGISADDEAAEADMGNIVPFENIRITEVLKTIRRVLKTSGGGGRIIRNSSDEKAAP